MSASVLTRRRVLLGAATLAMLPACATRSSDTGATPPIVFVHGNGDSAALWLTTLWRFESNGWPRDRLAAFDVPYPLARDDDTKPQEGRSSSAENRQALAAEVDRVRRATGADRVVLVANSRGGYAVRDYIAHGGAANVSAAVLGGTPNHGVWADPALRPGSEFNGAGAFLTALDAPQGPAGDEVTPGVRWLTIRSERDDKYAQPDGVWIGAAGKPTHVGYDGPSLKGAQNVVIAGIDHRETGFGPKAFDAMFRFIAGRAPQTLGVVPESRIELDGVVSGYGADNLRGTAPSNLPLAGATVEVYATDAATGERLGPAVHRRTIGADGRWGPMAAERGERYEFVVRAPGYATTHIYRSPFPRSSRVVNLRAERVADADRGAAAVVTLTRPRGYFGVPRDRISLDGRSPPAGIPTGTPGVSSAKLRMPDGAGRAVVGEFNGERIVGRAWPAADGDLVWLELND